MSFTLFNLHHYYTLFSFDVEFGFRSQTVPILSVKTTDKFVYGRVVVMTIVCLMNSYCYKHICIFPSRYLNFFKCAKVHWHILLYMLNNKQYFKNNGAKLYENDYKHLYSVYLYDSRYNLVSYNTVKIIIQWDMQKWKLN